MKAFIKGIFSVFGREADKKICRHCNKENNPTFSKCWNCTKSLDKEYALEGVAWYLRPTYSKIHDGLLGKTQITEEWLRENKVGDEEIQWFKECKLSDGVDVIKALIAVDKFIFANWLIINVMIRRQYLAYAIFAAEQVIERYEKKYPEDKRPRQAIESAKAVLLSDTKENRAVAREAAQAAIYTGSAIPVATSAADYSARCVPNVTAFAAISAAVDNDNDGVFAVINAIAAVIDDVDEVETAAGYRILGESIYYIDADSISEVAKKRIYLALLNFGLELIESGK